MGTIFISILQEGNGGSERLTPATWLNHSARRLDPGFFSDCKVLRFPQANRFLPKEVGAESGGERGTGEGMRSGACRGPHGHSLIHLTRVSALSLGWLHYCFYGL